LRRPHQQARIVETDGPGADQDRVASGPHLVDPVEIGVVGQQQPLVTGAVEISVDRHAAAEQHVRSGIHCRRLPLDRKDNLHPGSPDLTSPITKGVLMAEPAFTDHALSDPGPVPASSIRTQVTVPLRFADGYATSARVFTFDGLVDGREHLALGLGDWQAALDRAAAGGRPPLVRPHSECLTGDVFGSTRCDCGPQLREAAERITVAGGILLYLRQEGRGIGLYPKIDAYALQDIGMDTYEANVALGHLEDERDYTAGAQMLLTLGADRVALLSNNPDKAAQLDKLGVTVAERIPTGVHLSSANVRYLATKAVHSAHTLNLPPT
jgi:GTP cyclohydrolase II